MSRDAADLHEGWNAIENELEAVWNSLDSPDAEERYRNILQRTAVLSKGGAKFPYRKATAHLLAGAGRKIDAGPLRMSDVIKTPTYPPPPKPMPPPPPPRPTPPKPAPSPNR
jgi:hypothetical protein